MSLPLFLFGIAFCVFYLQSVQIASLVGRSDNADASLHMRAHSLVKRQQITRVKPPLKFTTTTVITEPKNPVVIPKVEDEIASQATTSHESTNSTTVAEDPGMPKIMIVLLLLVCAILAISIVMVVCQCCPSSPVRPNPGASPYTDYGGVPEDYSTSNNTTYY